MATIAIYNTGGKKVGDENISDSVFAVPSQDNLLREVFVILSGNKRRSTAHTKTQSERQGSGKKPWKQKGTGRARTGSVRNPIWRKGGVTFGPSNEKNYTRKINKKVRQKALRVALSEKIRKNQCMVIDTFDFAEKKTQKFSEMLKNVKIKGSILAGFSEAEADIRLMSRNIAGVENIFTRELNVLSLLNNTHLLLSKDSLKAIEAQLSGGEDKKEE